MRSEPPVTAPPLEQQPPPPQEHGLVRGQMGAHASLTLALTCALVTALGACGGKARSTPKGSVGSSGVGSSGGTGSSSSSSSSSGGGGAGGGAPSSCDPLPASSTQYVFECSQPMGCGTGYACGGLDAVFDEQGCLRPSCYDDTDCPGTDRCYRPVDFGGCAPSTLDCADSGGGCECVGTSDCGGSYCVPDALYSG